MNDPINHHDQGDPVVTAAVAALTAFAGDISREQAATLLPHYAGWRELDRPQRAAILRRFPPMDDLGWNSGSMR